MSRSGARNLYISGRMEPPEQVMPMGRKIASDCAEKKPFKACNPFRRPTFVRMVSHSSFMCPFGRNAFKTSSLVKACKNHFQHCGVSTLPGFGGWKVASQKEVQSRSSSSIIIHVIIMLTIMSVIISLSSIMRIIVLPLLITIRFILHSQQYHHPRLHFIYTCHFSPECIPWSGLLSPVHGQRHGGASIMEHDWCLECRHANRRRRRRSKLN